MFRTENKWTRTKLMMSNNIYMVESVTCKLTWQVLSTWWWSLFIVHCSNNASSIVAFIFTKQQSISDVKRTGKAREKVMWGCLVKNNNFMLQISERKKSIWCSIYLIKLVDVSTKWIQGNAHFCQEIHVYMHFLWIERWYTPVCNVVPWNKVYILDYRDRFVNPLMPCSYHVYDAPRFGFIHRPYYQFSIKFQVSAV